MKLTNFGPAPEKQLWDTLPVVLKHKIIMWFIFTVALFGINLALLRMASDMSLLVTGFILAGVVLVMAIFTWHTIIYSKYEIYEGHVEKIFKNGFLWNSTGIYVKCGDKGYFQFNTKESKQRIPINAFIKIYISNYASTIKAQGIDTFNSYIAVEIGDDIAKAKKQ